MTTHPRAPKVPHSPGPRDPGPEPVRLEEPYYLAAAMRLLPAPPHLRLETARRFLAGTKVAGYSLTNMWGTIETGHPAGGVREVCLTIEGPGRTAMCFVSCPADGVDEPSRDAERGACVAAAWAHVDPERIALAQGLPEPHETWAPRAYRLAGFTHAGELDYLELDLHTARKSWDGRGVGLPDGLRLVSPVDAHGAHRDLLVEALDASYVQTLDCPELCGLRDTRDVLESHLTTGAYDPALWVIVCAGERGIGCSLVSPIPENGSAELVYIGLAPEARGRGLGLVLMRRAIAQLRQRRVGRFVCAVDQRNAPARKLYTGLGFRVFSARSAWVRAVRAPSASTDAGVSEGV